VSRSDIIPMCFQT